MQFIEVITDRAIADVQEYTRTIMQIAKSKAEALNLLSTYIFEQARIGDTVADLDQKALAYAIVIEAKALYQQIDCEGQ